MPYFNKGIKVCDRWLGKDGFANFYKDMGERPKGMTLDRADSDSDYTPENCRWATPCEQANNRKSNRIVIIDGQEYTIANLARKLGIRDDTLAWRLENWSDMHKILHTPVKSWKYDHKITGGIANDCEA